MQPTDDAILFADSIDGVGRVEELEDVISTILDLWDENMVIPNTLDPGEIAKINSIYDHAWAVLASEGDEEVI